MRGVVVACVLSLGLAGCGGGGDGRVLVAAAASLTDVFADIEVAFEAAHPGLDVVLNLGGTSTLREQILGGAPADVFASADSTNMDRLVGAGAVGQPSVFAGNRLEIAVPLGNPAQVAGLADFAESSSLIGLCAREVPCGAMANLMFGAARITPSVDTEEPNVRALLAKIREGELDAGIVYATDVIASSSAVTGIEIPDDHNVFTDYPVAIVVEAPNLEGARAFVAFVLSPEGQQILADHGFLTYG